jgi:hypothetical protein
LTFGLPPSLLGPQFLSLFLNKKKKFYVPLHIEMLAKDGFPLLPESNSGGGNLLIISGLQDWQTERHKQLTK